MAIDMITYEFLKNYVEGSVMGENATPRGIWTENPTSPYAKGHYVTWNNIVYIWYNEQNSANNNPEPGDGENWDSYWQEIVKNGNVYTKEETDALIKSTDRYTYYTPSTGLEIKDGEVVGIGTCTDECVVIPEILSDGTQVTEVAREAFWTRNGDSTFNNDVKTIILPPSISFLHSGAIFTQYCPNLKAIYIMNPNIKWDDENNNETAMHLHECVTDIYFAGSRQQWLDINAQHKKSLIALKPENIAAGLVPTMHYGHFASRAVVDEKLKNPSYEEDVKLTGITTVEGAMDAEITDNMLAGAGNSFHVNITGHIKFHCEVDKDGGWATVMDVELGGDTGVYEYSFEGVVEDGFDVYCSFAGVTFTEFVKKVYVKDAIGDMDTALDAILAIQESIIGGAEQ